MGFKEAKSRQHDEGTEGRLSPAQEVRRKGVQIFSVESKFAVPNAVIDWIRASPSAQPLIHVNATFTERYRRAAVTVCGSYTMLSCEQEVLENT